MKRLLVQFHGGIIGHLTQTPEGRIEFQYTSDYLKSNTPTPLSHSLPLREAIFTERECIGFFGGLLPEEYNRKLIAKNIGVSDQNDFAMLREIGGECAGAVAMLLPSEKIHSDAPKYTAISDSELIHLLDQLPQQPLLAGKAEVRLSLAGAQNKIALYKQQDQFLLPLNESPSSHILKPALERFTDLTLNEAYCLELANSVGLPTAKATAQQFGPHHCLVVERFDRFVDNNEQLQRLHQEDFCQALGIPTRIKYQNEGGPSLKQCFQLIRASSASPARDLIHLFNTVLFNYCIGNNDAHGKNFSLLYTAGSARLAPLYDLVSTVCYPELSDKMAMKIGGNYLPKKLRINDWERLWAEIEFSKPQARKQTLQFIEKLRACCDHPENPMQERIQQIAINRIEGLQNTL